MEAEFTPIQTTGHIRRIDVHGLDALGDWLVIDIEVGPPDAERGRRLGTFTLSLDELKRFFLQAADALEEAEERAPKDT